MNKPRPAVLLILALLLVCAVFVVTMWERIVGEDARGQRNGQKAGTLQLASVDGGDASGTKDAGTGDPKTANSPKRPGTAEERGDSESVAPASEGAPESGDLEAQVEKTPRVATIDFQRVVDTHADSVVRMAKLEKLRQAALAEEETLIENLTSKEAELAKMTKVLNSGVLRGPKQEEKLAEARALQDELGAADRKLRALIEENSRSLVAVERKAYEEVSLKIRNHLTPKLAREGYDYLIRLNKNREFFMRGAVVVVRPGTVDITAEVIAELKAKSARDPDQP